MNQRSLLFQHFVAWWTGCLIAASVGTGTLDAQVVQTLPAPPQTDWHESSFWETVDGQPPELSWKFSDAEVQLVKPRGGHGSLISGPLPTNFELSWQWKIEPGVNTGVKYRVRQFGNRWLGVEYQIIDDGDTSSPPAIGSTASIYDLVAPATTPRPHPAGQWNDARVVARGDHLQHYLNGALVSEVITEGPEWDYRIAVSKFYGAERFGEPVAGDRVMLTDHGGKATYRNFQFVTGEQPATTDPASPPAASAELTSTAKSSSTQDSEVAGPFLANALRNSWADQDSIVLWTRTTAVPAMVTDGPAFVTLSNKEANELSRLEDPQAILAAQLPPDASLETMFGACPGAAGEVRLTYFPGRQRKAMKVTEWQTTQAEQDFTAQWTLEGLKSDTEYVAVIEARPVGSDKITAVIRGGFRTAPRGEQAKDLAFCVTTCHDFIRRDDGGKGHKIYPSMSAIDPAFVVHAGDIEYYDKPDPWAMTIPLMRFKWGRLFALPSNRDFYRNTTSYFLKDDHDTLKNDCWAGQRYGAVSFESGVRLFNDEQFPRRHPRYQSIRWGRDLQIWLLEGRDYRSPNNAPDGPDKTILGDEQKAWLFESLETSEATFKLIFSPTPLVGPDRKNKKDNHANEVFAYEGNQLREELSKHPGVIVFCGDRHWQYASVDEQTGLWEFGCGPGSEKHQLGWKAGDERPAHRFLRVAGGFLSGQLASGKTADQARLTIRHHQVGGEPVSEFVFPADR